MKTVLSILLSICFLDAFAGTPGMNDTTMIYALILLIVGGVAGIGLLYNRAKNKLENNKTDSSSEQEDDDTEYFNQTGI